ncbi:MAG: BlaI/MecI/CopY family transcriptional regulator [Bacteroidetes bacterium]|nr:BlaI/MecI/CopY family transcriptional regulator [Bacteroidota bacterium]
MEKLTPQEEQAMQALWKLEEGGVVKDILETYPEPQPPYTTLASTMKNLEKKGYVISRRYGNVYWYEPALSSESYSEKMLSGIIDNYFQSSYRSLVAFFAQNEKISRDDLEEIVKLIENKK